MKPQDIIFLIAFLLVVYKRNFRLSVGIGLVCLLFAAPLFAKWIFFTAERLVYYAAGFIVLGIVLATLGKVKGK
jgi:hypothetical protein